MCVAVEGSWRLSWLVFQAMTHSFVLLPPPLSKREAPSVYVCVWAEIRGSHCCVSFFSSFCLRLFFRTTHIYGRRTSFSALSFMVLQSWKIFGFTRDYKNVDGRFDPGAARPKRDKLIRKKKFFFSWTNCTRSVLTSGRNRRHPMTLVSNSFLFFFFPLTPEVFPCFRYISRYIFRFVERGTNMTMFIYDSDCVRLLFRLARCGRL